MDEQNNGSDNNKLRDVLFGQKYIDARVIRKNQSPRSHLLKDIHL